MPRKRNVRERMPKQLFHILCEGEKTEPNYLKFYLKTIYPHWGNKHLIKIEEIEENTATSLVTRTIKMKKDPNNKLDIFWCVYDRESTLKYPDKLHLTALQRAKANKICVALSNVCFEVWVLLHRQDTCAAFNDYRHLRRDSNLKQLFNGYEKDYAFTSLTKEEIESARRNAKRLNQQTLSGADNGRDAPYQLNPYTNVYELLDAIDEFAQANP